MPVGEALDVEHAEEPQVELRSPELPQRTRETGARKRQPANSTILAQIFDEWQLQHSIESRRQRGENAGEAAAAADGKYK